MENYFDEEIRGHRKSFIHVEDLWDKGTAVRSSRILKVQIPSCGIREENKCFPATNPDKLGEGFRGNRFRLYKDHRNINPNLSWPNHSRGSEVHWVSQEYYILQ